MKKNQKGSALLWAVILLLIFDVVIAGALGISYSYYNRVFDTNNQRQAYLTSKGIIEDMVEKIKAGDSSYISLFTDLEDGDSVSVTIDSPNVSVLGTSRGLIERIDRKTTRGLLTITITTNYQGEDDTIKADMQLGKRDGVEHWQLLRYYKGDAIPIKEGKNIIEAKKTLKEMQTILNFKINNDIIKGLNDYFKADANAYQNVKDQYPEWKDMSWFDNTTIRRFLFYRTKPGTWPTFDLDEVQGSEAKAKLEKDLQTFKGSAYYIQPYFPPSSYTECIVYANSGNSATSWMNVNLIFNNGHWYYIEPGTVVLSDFIDGESNKPTTLSILNFSDQNTGTSSKERWIRFKEKYLTKENMVQ